MKSIKNTHQLTSYIFLLLCLIFIVIAMINTMFFYFSIACLKVLLSMN